MKEHNVESSLASLPRAAAVLEIRSSDLKLAIERGELPCVRVGASVLVDIEAVRNVLLRRARKGKASNGGR